MALLEHDTAEIVEIVNALSRRHPDVCALQIEEWARAEFDKYRDASVRAFIPLLVARAVNDRVRSIAVSDQGR